MIQIVFGLIAIFILYIILKLLSISSRVILRLITNSVAGLILLVIFNAMGSLFGTSIDITFVNALVAGVFGIPGLIVLLLVK